MDLSSDNQAEYQNHRFEGLDCQGEEILSKEFVDCIFARCSFVETTFRNCRFSACTFIECDLSLARVPDSSFTQTRFEHSNMMGINWTEASWPKSALLHTVDFCDCHLSHSTFIGLDLKKATMTGCVARNVDLSEANLSQARCSGTDFTESRFARTNLTEADLTGATNYRINATLNTLKKTRFSLPEAMSLLYSLDIVLSE